MYKCLVPFLLVAAMGCQQSQSSQTEVQSVEVPEAITQSGSWSVLAVDAGSGESLLRHNSQVNMTPASVTKLFTTAAALDVFGADYTYKTNVYLAKDNANSNVKHLVIKGSGDPTFGSKRFSQSAPDVIFDRLYKALKKAGVNEITGSVVVDESLFTGSVHASKRTWEDMGNYYGAAPRALSYRENTFVLTLSSPAGKGQLCKVIDCDPYIYREFDCHVKSASNKKDSAYIYGHPNMKTWLVDGTIPAGKNAFTIKGAMPSPYALFQLDLVNYLKSKGIRIKGHGVRIEDVSAGELTLVYTHTSPPLSEVVAVINKTSHNLFADHLLFLLPTKKHTTTGWDAANRALNKWCEKNLDDFEGHFYDGSGLSPFNGVSAQDVVQLMKYMDRGKNKEAFRASLSVAGEDGTLRTLLRKEAYKGRLLGKSGSFNGVLCYGGVLTTASGKEVYFAVMANHFNESVAEVKGEMEQLMMDLIDEN